MPSPVRFARYVVTRRVGNGAFATVYLGYDAQLDSPVAIKVLADNWAGDDHVRERFLGEGRLLRRVDSPHVVSVLDAGEAADGRPFLVMTFADAGTLVDQMAAGTPGSLDEAIEIIRQVGLGLTALHDHGIVHRDIKPANVLFRTSPHGVRAMVGDLGLGKVIDASSKITQIGGTPAYAAPEQARGERVTEAADQYALGALAYRLIEGRPAFSYDSLYAAQRPVAPTPMRGVLPEVEYVVLRALAADPGERWPSVSAFSRALAAVAPAMTELERSRLLSALPERTQLASRMGTGEGASPTLAQPVPAGAAGAAGGAVATGGEDGLAIGAGLFAPELVPGPAVGAVPSAAASASGSWVRRGLVAVVAAAAAIGGLYAGSTLAADPEVDLGPSTVSDKTGALSITVPGEWAKEVGRDGWVPPGQKRTLAALSVGARAGWQGAESTAPGVFVGLMPGSDVPDRLPTHPECAGPIPEVVVEPDRRTAVYTGCPGGVIVEFARQVTMQRYAWAQVRAADEATARDVLDSMTFQ